MPAPLSTPDPAQVRPPVWLQGGVVALLTTGCFLPTEGAVQGDTLWLAVLWIAAASMSAFTVARTAPSPRWNLADTGVALFVGGHLLSGCLTLFSVSDRYTASILLVEWLGLAAAWFSLRIAFAGQGLPAQVFSLGVLVAATLSLYGLWQSAVWYPSMAAEFGPKMELVRTLGPAAPEAATAVRELHAAGIPTEGSALILFEKRLRDSREPFGLFALANTFGGFLAVWTLVGIGLWRRMSSAEWRKRFLFVALIAMIAGCLWLTNSRTAWGGLAIGLAGMIAGRLGRRPGCGWMPRAWTVGAGVAAVGVVLYGLAGDWQRTAPPGPLKSLVYRFQYWQGTWRFLQEDWLLGTGLGQFRGHYTAHKLPEASEDIADPHNLWLDAWCNGGLPALVGLLLVFIAAVRPAWNPDQERSGGNEPSTAPAWNPLLAGGAAAGMMLAFLGPFLLKSEWNDAPLVLLFVWGTLTGTMTLAGIVPIAVPTAALRSIAGLAVVALGIHLVGAGGIGMSAVVQTLFLFVTAALPSSSRGISMPNAAAAKPVMRSTAAGVAFAASGVLALWFVVIPVQSADVLLRAGDKSVMDGRRDFAGRAYREAAAIAPLWVEPWLRIATLEEQAWKTANRRDDARFEAGLTAIEAAWQRSPGSYLIAQQAARLWTDRAATTGAASDREQACTWARRAAAASPTNALALAELALALSAAGDPTAAETARRALAQHQINDRHGHVDRYLPPALLERLSTLTAASTGARSSP